MPKAYIKKIDRIFISLTACLLIVSIIGWSFIHEDMLIISLMLSTVLICFVLLKIYHKLVKLYDMVNADYKQLESLFSIIPVIKPIMPLPSTRGWAASPDFLKEIVAIVFSKRPELVIEASSGVSTLIIAYCLKQIGKGKVISLEHDPKYAAISQETVMRHGLGDIATVIHAPLKEFEINGTKWLWYDTNRLKFEQSIDLFVVDGPPGSTQSLARYPALPLLYESLGAESIIILDDGNRSDEREIVERWGKEFKNITYEFLKLEKGAFIINKH